MCAASTASPHWSIARAQSQARLNSGRASSLRLDELSARPLRLVLVRQALLDAVEHLVRPVELALKPPRPRDLRKQRHVVGDVARLLGVR